MKGLITVCAVLLQLNWCSGFPGARGVGAYAYQDSTGNRYGGTYGLDDKDIVNDPYIGPQLTNFADNYFPNFIIPNYDNILQEIFAKLEAQRSASYAPYAFDMTSNQIGEFPNFSRFPTFGPPNFFGTGGLPFDMSQPNSAFASGVAGPGFSHQIAAINPENNSMKNVEVTNRFNDDPGNPNKFYSVSSSSYSSSANLGGKENSLRGSETIVNNNGRVTKYRVQN